MENSDKITFIIPNRGNGENIDFIVKHNKKFFPKSLFIVVNECDEEPFKRGQLFNIGVKYVDTEYICMIDNDMFFDKDIDLISIYKEKKCIALQPFNVLNQVKINKVNNSYNIISKRGLNLSDEGGATFISKDNFIKYNGFSNLYVGWGFEDNEFCRRFNGKTNISCDIYHITHPQRGSVSTNNKNIKLNSLYYNERDKRNYLDDGYNQIKFKLLSDKIENGIRYLDVDDIRVCDNFKYKDLLNKHYE